VREDFMDVLEAILKKDEDVGTAMVEYQAYNKREGVWSQPRIWAAAKQMEPHHFWDTYKSNTVYLGDVAALILRATHGAGGIERILSTSGRVNSNSRARMLQSTLARWTRVQHNQRLADKRKLRGQARERALARVNARRARRPLPERVAPKSYPLQDDQFWATD
jgi:hypothetical protein